MNFDEFLMQELSLSKKKAYEIAGAVDKYNKTKGKLKEKKEKNKLKIIIPNYSLGEEIFNSVSHGIGALLAIAMLVLMVVKAKGALAITTCSLFGATAIILYIISCIYHALSKNLEGKKVLRVIDHCNVYMLVYGTYIPMFFIGIGGRLGWIFLIVISLVTILGIVLTAINVDKSTKIEVICHLANGWAAIVAIPKLLQSMGTGGVVFLILGGLMYTIGSVLYGVGHKIKYTHCVFHIFCLLGTLFHFLCIYMYLL
mgnify:CR=1 FL=1